MQNAQKSALLRKAKEFYKMNCSNFPAPRRPIKCKNLSNVRRVEKLQLPEPYMSELMDKKTVEVPAKYVYPHMADNLYFDGEMLITVNLSTL